MKVNAPECLPALVLVLSAGVAGAFVSPPVSSGRTQSTRLNAVAIPAPAIPAPAVKVQASSAVDQEVLDFAIVGGGPAGLAAAVGLKAKGLNVKVFEGAL